MDIQHPSQDRWSCRLFEEEADDREARNDLSFDEDFGQRTKDKPTTSFHGSDVGLDTARVR